MKKIKFTKGPIHPGEMVEKIALDCPSPKLKSGEAAVTTGTWISITDTNTGEWQWSARWEILENS